MMKIPSPLAHDLREQFAQICKGPVWDGNVICSTRRDRLWERGLVSRVQGWNFLSEDGVRFAVENGFLKVP